jgi:hypothetical protein
MDPSELPANIALDHMQQLSAMHPHVKGTETHVHKIV